MMPRWAGALGRPTRFDEQYHCYSVAYADRGSLEGGDKILLPPSAFDTLSQLHIDYPMLFQLQSSDKGTLTHCGVLEFTAQEGSCYIPFWMMQNLLITEGSVINVTNVSLPKATFVKLQPQHVDFLEISNPRAVLEHALRNFSCVTKGDVICVPYNKKNYHFELKEVKPKDAACIIETDCNVDFDAPVGYKDPSTLKSDSSSDGKAPPITSPLGTGDSKTSTSDSTEENDKKPPGIRIVDGKIVRPEDILEPKLDASMVAARVGGTGVQKNAAIPVLAPQVDYWAKAAGDGARLDGKAPTVLKDEEGNVIDVRKVRAEAAAKRLASLEAETNKKFPSLNNTKTLAGDSSSINGTAGENGTSTESTTTTAKPRKSRIGSKYSKRKGASMAFGGTAHTSS